MLQLNSASDTGYRGLELHNGSFGDGGTNRRLQIVVGEGGSGAASNHFGVRVNGNNSVGFIDDLGAINTSVNFFLIKVSFSATAGADVVSIWRNPTDLSSELGSGVADFVSTPLDFTFDRVSFACFSATGFQADEIRVGNSWADVTTAVSGSDTDVDGLPDAFEQTLINANAGDSVDGLEDVKGPADSPTLSDFDNDGLSDADEYARQTNANSADTDLDGDADRLEVIQGTDPTDSASSAASFGIAKTDGTRDEALYSTPLAVQTVNTQFGDNLSEWNAAYAYVNGGKLWLLFTGNLQDNFNKLEIFIDSKSGGSSTFTSAGNDGSAVMNGMKFDSNFAPDYHLIARRNNVRFDLDFANLTTPSFVYHGDVFGGNGSGSGLTGTGVSHANPILVGYNGTNSAGVVGGTGAANQTAAAAVSTGLEMCIDLADLGNPSGPFKVMLIQNNLDHDFISNQTLGGLPAGFGNLGNPANTKDFSTYPGEQFFSIDPNTVHLFANNTAIRFTTTGLTRGDDYVIQESTTLNAFSDIPGSGFTADNTARVFSAPISTVTTPKYFLRMKKLPLP